MSSLVEMRQIQDFDIDFMTKMMREEEKRDFDSIFTDVHTGLTAAADASEVAYAGTVNGELLALFGYTTNWQAGFASPWLALSRNAADHKWDVARWSKKIVLDWAADFELLCNVVPTFDDDAIRLLRFMGFQFLNEAVTTGGIERMPFYMVGGKN